jgi:hypothetical protein
LPHPTTPRDELAFQSHLAAEAEQLKTDQFAGMIGSALVFIVVPLALALVVVFYVIVRR